MSAVLDVPAAHLAILRACLRRHLPPGAGVFAFGSRIHGTARPYSDLDLALNWERPLSLDTMAALADELSDSDLPYRVDLVDATLLEPAFRARLAAEWLPISLEDPA